MKVFVVYMLVMLVTLIVSNNSYGQETKYIFNPKKVTLDENNLILNVNIEEPNFRIRPISDRGITSIYFNETWVPSNSPWVELPVLLNPIILKTEGLETGNRFDLRFALQDISTGKTYLTSPITVFTDKELETYHANLNEFLRSYEKAESKIERVSQVSPSETSSKNPNIAKLAIFYSILFIMGSIVGFKL